MKINKIVAFFFVLIIFWSCGISNSEKSSNPDVIIYGGTSAAISAAVQLAQMDKSVLIVCPDSDILFLGITVDKAMTLRR